METEKHATATDASAGDHPPYFGRNATYYGGWTEKDEHDLHGSLTNAASRGASFLLSSWERDMDGEEDQWQGYPRIRLAHHYSISFQGKGRGRPVTELLIADRASGELVENK